MYYHKNATDRRSNTFIIQSLTKKNQVIMQYIQFNFVPHATGY